jgi:hypothetical protein
MSFVHRSDVSLEQGNSVVAAHLDEDAAPPMECCGCPDTTACADYCRSQYGAAGGYCEGFLDLRCVCKY